MTTMTTPTLSKRNTRLLVALKALEIAMGFVSLGAGVWVFAFPPSSFIQNVAIPWLIIVWGSFFLIGGLGAVIGRLTDIWLPETVGIVSMAIGAIIYLCTVSVSAVLRGDPGAGVVVALIIFAILAMGHRYVELQRLTVSSTPGTGFWDRVLGVIFRRTARPTS